MARFLDEQKAMLDEHMQKNICEAAIDVLAECGVEKITMDKIAEAAGVAKGTIYNYFKDKNQLLATIAGTVFDPIFINITKLAHSDSDVLFKLQEIARIMLEAFSRHKKIFILLHETKISGLLGNKEPFDKRNKLISIVEKIIKSAMDDGQFRSFQALIVAEIFLGMVMSINISKITTGTERLVQEDLDTIMAIFTNGILKNLIDSEVIKNEC